MIPKPKDSGVRENFSTGSVRDTRVGKGRFDLLPTRALKLIALHFENGAEKYGDRNWEKGQKLSRFLDSALRHAFAHLEGKRDEPHDVAAAWNLLCLIDTEQRIKEGLLPKELDDLSQLTQWPVKMQELLKDLRMPTQVKDIPLPVPEPRPEEEKHPKIPLRPWEKRPPMFEPNTGQPPMMPLPDHLVD